MATTPSPFRVTPQVIVGLLIVLFGLALTADNLDIIEVDRLWGYWPFIVIAFGVAKFLQTDSRSGQVFGAIVILVGVALAGETLWGFRIDIWAYFPLVFVLMGVVMVMRAWRRPPPAGPGHVIPSLPGHTPAVPSSDSAISDFAIWSGSKRRVASQQFRRADLTAIMGGIELDLRPAATATGEAVIDVFVWWGGIDITVPPDWVVSNQAFALMGAVEDLTSGPADGRHRLVVRGFVVMGGVEIKTTA